MPSVIMSDSINADIEVDCLIIGGGAAGLTAALAAKLTGNHILSLVAGMLTFWLVGWVG